MYNPLTKKKSNVLNQIFKSRDPAWKMLRENNYRYSNALKVLCDWKGFKNADIADLTDFLYLSSSAYVQQDTIESTYP